MSNFEGRAVLQNLVRMHVYRFVCLFVCFLNYARVGVSEL